MAWTIKQTAENVVVVYIDSNKLNIIDDTFLDEFEAALDRLEKEYPLCSVVFTGNDRAFSAGLSLDKLRGSQNSKINPFNHPMVWSDIAKAPARFLSRQPLRAATEELISVGKYVNRVDELGWRLFKYPRKTVAALNGHAIAGGTFIAAACDVRIADGAIAHRSLLGLNEVANGFPIPYRMQLVCSQAFNSHQVAKQIILSGKLITLAQAREPSVGFVQELVGSESSNPKDFNIHSVLYPVSSLKTIDGTFLSPLLARAVSIASIDAKIAPAYAVNKAMLNEQYIQRGEEDLTQTVKHTFGLWAHEVPRLTTFKSRYNSFGKEDQDDDEEKEPAHSKPVQKIIGKL